MNWRYLFSVTVAAGFLTGCLESPSGGGTSGSNDPDESKPVNLAAEIEKAQKRSEGLEKRLEGLNKTLAKLTGADEGESGNEGADDKKSASATAGAEYVSKLRDSEAYFFGELQTWRQATRESFKGIEIGSITTTSGDVYSAVVITKVGDDTLEIEHSDGDATLEIGDLDKKLRRNLIHETTVLVDGGN